MRNLRRTISAIGLCIAAWFAPVGALAQSASADSDSQPSPFEQEIRTEFTRDAGLPSNDVHAVAVDAAGVAWAATAAGVARFDGRQWSVPLGGDKAILSRIDVDASGTVWGLQANAIDDPFGPARGLIFKITELSTTSAGFIEPGALHDLAVGPGRVVIAGEKGLFHARLLPNDDGRFRETLSADEALGEVNVSRVATNANGDVAVVIGHREVALRRPGGEWQQIGRFRADITAIHFAANGNLWLTMANGGIRYAVDAETWHTYAEADGLPVTDLTAIGVDEARSVWFGTTQGAVRFDGTTWSYRAGRRWLPDNTVRDIALAHDGTAWFATPGGVSRIERRTITLPQKAAHYEAIIDARHRRFGYVTYANLERPGDLGKWSLTDTDNDGLWTAMYGAGECFHYAATGDADARRRAHDAFRAMNRLHDVTGMSGFPARTVVPAGGPDPNQVYTPERDREAQTRDPLWKVISPRWPMSADGRWYWKCDTSSDEIDGHYFFYAAFHDHAAVAPEDKAKAADIIRAMTDHIIEHDFFLVDHDGRPTRWGVWNPDKLNNDIDWIHERGLNSLEMLSFLATAHHVTGDEKYVEVARKLIEDHHYAINMQTQKVTFPPDEINHSDDEMAFMCYYNLIRYTKNDAWLDLYRRSLRRSWLFERPERNPLFNFIYGACGGEPFDGEAAVDTLQHIPWDLIDWRMTNHHRLDLRLVRDGLEPQGAWRRFPPFGVVSIDERYVQWWNHNPYTPDTGGEGRREADGAYFLLPYYLGLYHGFVR